MPRYSTSQTLPYACNDLYQIVADVEAYPCFVPGCQQVHILKREGHQMWAQMIVGEHLFSARYTSHVTCLPGQSVEARLVEGPFKSLESCWRFYNISTEQTKISFELEITCASALKNRLLSYSIPTLGERMVKAFQDRARHMTQSINKILS